MKTLSLSQEMAFSLDIRLMALNMG